METEGGPPARRDAQAPDIRPILVTFPHDDLAFAEHVFLAAERVGAWDRAAIMDRVRQSYPAAVAAEAEDIALVGGVPRWYVYRDGRASPRRIEDTWQDDPTTGVMVLDDEARYTDVNDAALELLGRQREDVVGTTAGGFTRHEDDAELSRRMFALADGQRLASIAIVVRPDGVERPIEFTMAHEDGGYVIRMRPIAAANGDPVPAPV